MAAQLLPRTIWSGMSLATANMSGFSAGVETVDDLVHLRWNKVPDDIWRGTTGYLSDLGTALRLFLHQENPIAPEALDISEEQWHRFSTKQHMIDNLKAWAGHDWPSGVLMHEYKEEDVNVFLSAARTMTVASALSYGNEDEIKRRMGYVENNDGELIRGYNSWEVKLLEHDGAEVLLLFAEDPTNMDKTYAIVAFRGTELPDDDMRRQFFPDWLRNLNYPLTSFDTSGTCGHVAKGFLEAWRGIGGGSDGLKKLILDELKDYRTPVDLYLTGHSQGAALAAVSLLDLLKEQSDHGTYKVCGCLTLAQPKVGDEAHSSAVVDAVEKAKIPYDLVANEDATGVDPVVSMPWWSPNTTTPVGRFWKVRAGRRTHGPETLESHRAIVEVPRLPVAWRIATSFQLHWPGGNVGYLAALAE